ncbi:hypothetical protein TIFTF001_040481 [Ficus carica]|uniref:Uncharacterized protein n=1 Tax=Ficus carica TaxID=3494 RepID=A0AA87YU76_FICCA|nr:hypothetical protein TIFTF001_040481 [Ficus carica]
MSKGKDNQVKFFDPKQEYDTQRCPSKLELITGHSSFKQGKYNHRLQHRL